MKDRLVTIVLSAAVTFGLMQAAPQRAAPEQGKVLEVDRLIVRKELIVSDTGRPWEDGFERHQIPRGVYARALHDGPGGLWVRSRLIKGEIDDPFDDRFHALERDGSLRQAPGHISWNVWLDGRYATAPGCMTLPGAVSNSRTSRSSVRASAAGTGPEIVRRTAASDTNIAVRMTFLRRSLERHRSPVRRRRISPVTGG